MDLSTASAIVVAATLLTYYYLRPGWNESRSSQVGRWLLKIPYVKHRYLADIEKEREHFKEKVVKQWEQFGPPIVTIPEKGWSEDQLIALINHYSKITLDGLLGKHISGTIYSKSLDSKNLRWMQPRCISSLDTTLEPSTTSDSNDKDECFYQMITNLQRRVYTYAFEKSYLWNSLHSDEFGIGAYIDYQVVHMVAGMFGSNTSDIMGFVTSGGTESLILAIRCYRNWGMDVRGHAPGQGVVLACKSVHAAIIKAGQAYLVKIVLINTDENGRMDVDELRKQSRYYSNDVIAIIGSAPSYPLGVVDPIKDIADVALENGCGMHVDCCLGGFIINNLGHQDTNYLDIDGVTSLSADTHKNGFAPKGSSVLVTKTNINENLISGFFESRKFLAYYSVYPVPEWMGGVYGTPKDAGSQSCSHSLMALLAMLSMGRDGYQKITESINTTTMALADIICEFKGQLRLLANPEVNVVAFEIDKEWQLQPGAVYAFAYEMSKRNIILNALNGVSKANTGPAKGFGEAVHFCVTVRFSSNVDGLNAFRQAIIESLSSVKELNDNLLKTGSKFPGDAGMYCALEAALTPQPSKLPLSKYIENSILGKRGAMDAIRAYFLCRMDPFH